MPTTHTIRPHQGSYLAPAFEHATVADAMHPGILACAPDTSLTEVARIMATHHVHCVAVLGIPSVPGERQLWGVVSDLDLVQAADPDAPEEPTAGEIAATAPVTIGLHEPLTRAAQLLREHDVHHLVVVNGHGAHPVGVLSCLDIAGVIAWGRG